jgi:hypothetical protein
MSKLTKALTAAAGNAGESLYVEDVFSTYLYTGNSSTQTITNGIDLDGEGGMVWLQGRTSATGSRLDDTERPLNDHLRTFSTAVPLTYSVFSSLNSNGFSLVDSNMNSSGADYVSWTFRKAEKFFDVVTYTGDDTSNQTIAHNLGSVPGFIILKRTSTTGVWGAAASDNSGNYKAGWRLETTSASTLTVAKSNVATDSVVDVGYWSGNLNGLMNTSGVTYVAYLFASDAGGFGDDGSESIIKCGSYTTDGSEEATIDLGFEPQWVLFKRTDSATGGDWNLFDTMRGITADTSTAGAYVLETNTSDAEDLTSRIAVTSTGFKVDNYGASRDYIYIAIRRPMKTPESGTEVFAADTAGSVDTDSPWFRSGFPVDMAIRATTTAGSKPIHSRLTGQGQLWTNLTSAEAAGGVSVAWDYMNGFYTGTGTEAQRITWMFKRATGFFDVVAYTGDGTTTQLVEHNLVVKPELVIQKRRDSTSDWFTSYLIDGSVNKTLLLNSTGATGQPQAILYGLTYAIGAFNGLIGNINSANYIAYLFATLAGVSKVGSYTGTAADLNVDCGFSAGARFILIKRTDSTGDWYVWDSVRGIVAGNDPYLLLNSTAAEVTSTDYIDPLSSGFTVTSSASSTVNVSSGEYIFLAIA